VVSFCLFPLSISLVRNNLSGGPGGEHKGSLQRAVTARTADRKTGQNVRRHDLDRSYASMIKQKKIPTTRQYPEFYGHQLVHRTHCTSTNSACN